MTTAWDYAFLYWESQARKEWTEDRSKWVVTPLVSIRRPGVGLERRDDTNPWSLFEELGRDGWELVTESIVHSYIAEVNGYPEASSPIMMRWIFKRPRTDHETATGPS